MLERNRKIQGGVGKADMASSSPGSVSSQSYMLFGSVIVASD